MDDRARLPVSAQDCGREGEGPFGSVVWLKRVLAYSILIMSMIGGTMVAYYPVREYITEHAISLYFMAFVGLLFFTFLADLALMLVTSYLLRLGRISQRLYVATMIIIYFTGVPTMLTSVSLLLLLNPRYAVVTILVLPAIAIVSIVFYKGSNTGQAIEVDYEAHQSELKQFFDLSALVTVPAFAGMMGTIFSYFKNFPKDFHQVDVKFSEVFIFVTVISGLLVMLLTTVPASRPHPNAGSSFLTFIKVLSYSLFGLLALTGLAIAAEFLQVSILLAIFIPIFYAVAVWLSMPFNQAYGTIPARSATGHESEPDASSATITTFIFTLLMAVYSVYFVREENDFHLQTCMFFMFLAFMFSLSWMLLAFRAPRTQSLAKPVMVLTYSTFGLLVVATLDVIFLAIRTGWRKRQY